MRIHPRAGIKSMKRSATLIGVLFHLEPSSLTAPDRIVCRRRCWVTLSTCKQGTERFDDTLPIRSSRSLAREKHVTEENSRFHAWGCPSLGTGTYAGVRVILTGRDYCTRNFRNQAFKSNTCHIVTRSFSPRCVTNRTGLSLLIAYAISCVTAVSELAREPLRHLDITPCNTVSRVTFVGLPQ